MRISRSEVLWLVYAMAKGLSQSQIYELVQPTFKMSSGVRSNWGAEIRRVAAADCRRLPPMGGDGRVVYLGCNLLRAKWKKRSKRAKLEGRANGSAEGDPWVLIFLCDETREARMVCLPSHDTATIQSTVVLHLAPVTTVITQDSADFEMIPWLQDSSGESLNLTWKVVRHPYHFKDPDTGLSLQLLGQAWKRAKELVHRAAKGSSATEAVQLLLDWVWWTSLNGPKVCRDPFLRLVEAISRQFPMSTNQKPQVRDSNPSGRLSSDVCGSDTRSDTRSDTSAHDLLTLTLTTSEGDLLPDESEVSSNATVQHDQHEEHAYSRTRPTSLTETVCDTVIVQEIDLKDWWRTLASSAEQPLSGGK